MLERDASGYRNHPRLEGGELSVGHVTEPFRYRVSRKMQIQGLRWAAIAAVQKRRRGGEACRIRVVVLRKVNQCVDRQARKLASLYHQVTNSPTVCAGWAVRIGGEFRRAFRPAARVSTAALYNQPLPVLLPRTSKAYMGRFSETWQHPAIYNLIDHSSNLLSTCSRVRPIFITRSALLHLVGDSALRDQATQDLAKRVGLDDNE